MKCGKSWPTEGGSGRRVTFLPGTRVFAQTTSSPSFALRDEEEEEKEEEEETRYRTVVSGQRGCSITGNSHDHQQSLRYLRPQAAA